MGRKAKIKTIDVNCCKWRDKVNGNTYFAGSVTINFKMATSRTFKIPYQYGYGNQYEHEALRVLKEHGYNVHFGNLKNDNIIYRHFCQADCLKRDLMRLDKQEY